MLPMARIRRVVAVGCSHHITQRGNFRRDLFFDDEDRQLRILGYCSPETTPSRILPSVYSTSKLHAQAQRNAPGHQLRAKRLPPISALRNIQLPYGISQLEAVQPETILDSCLPRPYNGYTHTKTRLRRTRSGRKWGEGPR